MFEVGVELEGVEPRLLTAELASRANLVVTMGCGEECPVVPGARYLDWEVEDPSGQPLDRVRRILDEILDRVRELVMAEGWV
jgi:arsenate reductase